MARSNSPSRLSASLQRFRLDGICDTGITVGYGSYATVLQYDFRGFVCAGKKIHRLLYQHIPGTQRADILQRFEEECDLLGQLNHPNIVQFLGVHVETGAELPVLVMEYLPTNLSGYLARHGVLTNDISYGILRDVALGLRYLHEYSPPIVHRDLSANNVLLTASLSAKISDLGVSKILTVTPQMTQQMSTKAPGTPCYMPPEALLTEPNYTRKIDSYSFGVLILHVLCGKWPFPTDAFQCDPHDPDVLVPVTEVGRRAEFLQQMGSGHPLLRLVHQCLSNAPNERPVSADILQQINTALSQVPAPAETVLQQLEGLRSENQNLGSENQSLMSKNLRLRSDAQMLRTKIQNLRSENERLKNKKQTLNQFLKHSHPFSLELQKTIH